MSLSGQGARAVLMVAAGVAALLAVLLAEFSWIRRRTPIRDLDPADLEARLREGDVAVVDVRTEREYRNGHLPGALSAPLGTVLDHLDKIPRDRDIVLICQTAHRSVVAARTLADHGYDRLYHLVPGMRGWRGPVERESAEE